MSKYDRKYYEEHREEIRAGVLSRRDLLGAREAQLIKWRIARLEKHLTFTDADRARLQELQSRLSQLCEEHGLKPWVRRAAKKATVV